MGEKEKMEKSVGGRVGGDIGKWVGEKEKRERSVGGREGGWEREKRGRG